MKSFFCRLFSLAAVGMLAAAPAVADDVGIFRLDQPVQVGNVTLSPSVYVFRASDRGIVSVFDQEKTEYVAVTFAIRQPLDGAKIDAPATLTHDWAVRTLTLGDKRYGLIPGKAPEKMASRPKATTTTVVALAR